MSDRGFVGNAVPKSSSNPVYSPHPVLAGDGQTDAGGVMSSMRSELQALCLQAIQQEVQKLQQRKAHCRPNILDKWFNLLRVSPF